MATTTNKKATKATKTIKTVKTKLDLEKEIEELKKMLENNSNTSIVEKPIVASNAEVELSKDRDVLFTSLCAGMLNLQSKDDNVYTFEKFGDEQMIPYDEARTIIRKNKSFIIGGKVFINDDDLIKSERLQSTYKNILDKNSLLDLFTKDSGVFEKIFENMPDTQKEVFKDIIINKLMKNERVDMNIIKIVEDVLYKNQPEELRIGILKEVENSKAMISTNE